MTTRTSLSLKQAFKRFVELVQPIEDVRHVVAFDGGLPEISTYITKLDESVSSRVFQAESKILEEFPRLPVDFHVWYLEGKELSDFVPHPPPLAFSKNEPAQSLS